MGNSWKRIGMIVGGLSMLGSLNMRAAEPELAASWTFEGKDTLGAWQGKAVTKERAPGPRAPRYPGFDEQNQAAFFPGTDAALVVKDQESLRFTKGDSITLETWVRVQSIGRGHQVYLIGKGRLGTKEFGSQNQNYAVRLQGTDSGTASIGFLFASKPEEGKPSDWHRWWSKESFTVGRWHHVAISYTFGQADSLRGYIDGKLCTGTWDLGGKTDRAPVSDGDDLMIGTGYERKTSQSLIGWLDEVRIHRAALPAENVAARYAYSPPPPPVTRENLQDGQVLVQICEDGVPPVNAWPEDPPNAAETYQEDVFGFFELPQKYISTGVRADRPNPSLMRATALVTFPAGQHRILLRGRGAARVYIDGKLVVETPFPKGDTGGHGQVAEQNEYLDLGPDFRFVPPGNREAVAPFATDGGQHLVMMETMVGGVAGGNKRRPELGETVVAMALEGSDSWALLSPGRRQVPYTDEGWAAYEAERTVRIHEMNRVAREARRAEHGEYWTKRREAAKSWLASAPEVAVPALPAGYPAQNPIDHFVAVRIAEVAKEFQAQAGGVDYHKQIKPILEGKCYDCHQGGKAKGGLLLNNHAAALKGGKSDGAAIAPGKPDESALMHRIVTTDPDEIMPPKGDPLTAGEIDLLRRWIQEGAHWPEFQISKFELTPLTEDLTFLRRLYLDTVGVPPTEKEIASFLADHSPNRRATLIDRLLQDARWADNWMGYWQDVLAENPNIINPTLNNTGPFRWWLYESLLDDKPADLFVTELVRMEGSERFGGPRGFGTASNNDVPMAAKGIILSSAFLGVEMKCARCHDAPAHVSKQEDLFKLAAMLETKPLKVPTTSSVPMDRIHATGRKPLIEVTLAPGSVVDPGWPFERYCDEATAKQIAENPDDSRDLLAALLTAPKNERFAQVMTNRVWQRLMGRGLVADLADWEKGGASHPELLQWLSREFVRGGYSLKSLSRTIMNSHAYQRATDPTLTQPSPLYVAPAPRRLGAEQIVDSLFAATGKPFKLEEVSLDLDSVRTQNSSITLGKARRSWMLTSTSNERDRPSLSLPRIQAVCSVLEAFGWRGARPDSASVRDTDPNVLQPAILSNGVMGTWLTRLSDDHGITSLAMEGQPVESLIDRLFMRLLTRHPNAEELERYTAYLSPGYDVRRLAAESNPTEPEPRARTRYVTWSNHLDSAANLLAQEHEADARRGEPGTKELNEEWRRRMEDVLWALLNAPEWVYTP